MTVSNGLGSLTKSPRGFLFTFGRNDLWKIALTQWPSITYFRQLSYLSPGLAGSLGLRRHGSLQLHRQANIFSVEDKKRGKYEIPVRLASFCHYFVVVFFKKEKQQKVKELGITLGHVDNKESCTKKHLKSVQQNMRHLVDSGEKNFPSLPSQCLKIAQNVAILAFSTNFCPIKTDLSGNTVWPQASGFLKLAKMDHFWPF